MDHNSLINLSKQAGEIIKESGYDSIIASHKLLHSRLENPQSYTAIIGETSSGKSTIINGLFSKKILPSSAKPTTGAVTQLIINNALKNQEFVAINRDATVEIIDQKMFSHLVEKPDEKLLRLRTILAHPSQKYDGLNIFDTPGYNSLIIEHEEVLRNFIPECDLIIHVVGYRVGFGEQDQFLLSSVYEQTKDRDISLILVVNRCPSEITLSSKRIVEIYNHAKDTFHKELEIILIPSIIQEDLENPIDVLPKASELWNSLFKIVNSEKRKEQLKEHERYRLLQLLRELSLTLEENVLLSNLDKGDLKFLKEQVGEFVETKEKLYSILDIYIERWKRTVPKLLEKNISELIHSTTEIIQDDNKWLDSNSCIAYIQTHQLPFNLRKIIKEVNNYLKIQMEEMNDEMEDVSNQALKKLTHSINYNPSKTYSDIVKVLANKIGMRLLGDTSKAFLKARGGIGGIASGTGNTVKTLVSKSGKLFGKTFSKEVYNNIGRIFTKKMIAKLNVAFMVGVEVISYVYESKTWQGKLKKHIEKNLNTFKKESTREITMDMIESVKKSNIEAINDVFLELEININNEIDLIENNKEISQLEGLRLKTNKLIKELSI